MNKTPISEINNRDQCVDLDQDDPLRACRDRFQLAENLIYLDGNSLGAMPKSAPEALSSTVEREWGEDLIRSWNDHQWFTLPGVLGDQLGQLLGAANGQIVVCDTTSVNLYKAIRAALSLQPDRTVLVAESDNFPTDLYIIEGAITGAGRPVQTRLSGINGDSILELIDSQVAVVVVSHVNYKTSEILPMAELTRAVHDAGAVVVWDLSHSAGVLPIELDRCQVDFAVGCSYKYLNGGPGSPAYIYVADRHIDKVLQPLSGWWGHHDPFAFDPEYRPHQGINRFLCGTQPVLSMKGVGCGLDTYQGVCMSQVRKKSSKLGDLFVRLVSKRCAVYPLTLTSPAGADQRGSHVSFSFEHGYPVIKALIERGVIGDFRPPDTMRFGFSPLYIRYCDIWDAVEQLRQCLQNEVWLEPRYCHRAAVT